LIRDPLRPRITKRFKDLIKKIFRIIFKYGM